MFKCKKCRFNLIDTEIFPVLNSHGERIVEINNKVIFSCRNFISDTWYLQDPEIPEWMIENINTCEWQKGKLKCPQCDARIGSFNFISGIKCFCEKVAVPPIHLVKSKIDVNEKIKATT